MIRWLLNRLDDLFSARRAAREQAILAALEPDAGINATELAQLLDRRPGTLHPDLARLEGEGRIRSWWTDGDAQWVFRRRLYARNGGGVR